MKAALRTEGKTTTQSALSRRPCGMSSGIFRISDTTLPAFSTRSTSFVSSAASAAVALEARNRAATRETRRLFMSLLLKGMDAGTNTRKPPGGRDKRSQHYRPVSHIKDRRKTEGAGFRPG